MELKHRTDIAKELEQHPFNRTRMELKRVDAERDGAADDLLTVPEWN